MKVDRSHRKFRKENLKEIRSDYKKKLKIVYHRSQQWEATQVLLVSTKTNLTPKIELQLLINTNESLLTVVLVILG